MLLPSVILSAEDTLQVDSAFEFGKELGQGAYGESLAHLSRNYLKVSLTRRGLVRLLRVLLERV